MVKRYNEELFYSEIFDDYSVEMEEWSDGQYVTYQDYKLLKDMTDKMATLLESPDSPYREGTESHMEWVDHRENLSKHYHRTFDDTEENTK